MKSTHFIWNQINNFVPEKSNVIYRNLFFKLAPTKRDAKSKNANPTARDVLSSE